MRIKSVDDFISFKNNVNKGTSYEGTTVFLDSDIDLTGKTFEPISNRTDSRYFLGVFDGQGHVISNLKMNSSFRYVGLFGSSEGLTIRNVILDSSCSITSSFSGSGHAYVGGIIGECNAYRRLCTIENNVNMGSVTFSGNLSGYSYSYLGGVAVYLCTKFYDFTVKNCANYGDITHSGWNSNSYIGGIVGYSSGSSPSIKRMYIYNSINHGTITHNGTTSYLLYLGGIGGYTYLTTIENCVSAGKISTPTSAPSYNYIGRIVGQVNSYTSINYCYFTSDLSGYKKYGRYSPSTESNTLSYNSTTFGLNGTVSIGSYTGSSLIGALNAGSDYYTLRDYSHWLLNKDKKAVSFTINGRPPFSLSYQIILMPNLASEGNKSFDGWYTDSAYSKVFTTYEATSDTELHGKIEENTNNYTITFETRRERVFVAPITAPFGSVVTLPSNLTDGKYSIVSWENKYGDKVEFFNVPPYNVTLYAVWKCVHIETPEDFIDFAKVVNSGTSYSAKTVFLDSDIDFTGKSLEPIGNSTSIYFRGTFDGQGHVISNLAMNSSSDFVGLFGYSRGLTVKNLILDSSCSITSSLSGFYETYVGGIIGKFDGYHGPCDIKNSVNMASVTFGGSTSNSLYLGGIAGYIYSSYTSYVKNCANYGDVTHSGTSGYSYIVGIAGSFCGSSSFHRVYIYNCLNLGTITLNGTTSYYLYIGGIVGRTFYTNIENCVSGGKISAQTTASNANYIGSIVGEVDRGETTINYTYFTSDLNSYNKYGYNRTIPIESNIFSYDNTTFQLSDTVSSGTYTGTSLIGALNGYAAYKGSDYSHWLLNKEKKAVSFTINGRKDPIRMSYQIILLPNPGSEGNTTFDGWYMDRGLTVPLTSFEVNESISIYGELFSSSIVVVTFDVNGGNALSESELTKEMRYNNICGDLPEATRTGYTFAGWFTEAEGGEEIKSGNVVNITGAQTLYAHWTPSTYNITFDGNWGDTAPPIKEVTYDSEYGALPEPERTGYTFTGWFTEEEGQGVMITEATNVTIAANHTLYAKWKINNYTITFDYGDGRESEERVLDFNEPINYTEGLVRDGYTFAGWDMKPDTMPAQDLTIKAQWTPNNYTLSFDALGGEGVGNDKKNVTYDSEYGDLPEPTKTGYTFSGWFTDVEGGEKIKSGDIVKITEDKTLYAHWIINQYTITFEVDGGSECEDITQDYNTEIVLPEPTKTGYTFDCWCSDLELRKEYSETTMPAEDVTLYAKWIINQYNLTIIFNNGAENEVRTLDYNEKIVYPENVEKTGYTFSGWDSKPDRMPAENINITAQWTPNKYTVSFNPTGGNVDPTSIEVSYNSTYGELPIATRTGYTFGGWFTEEEGQGERITEDTNLTATEDHTLYAHWAINNYTITFDFGNGADAEERVLDFNEPINYTEDVVREGYTFAGWDMKPNTMPAQDLTIKAQWTPNNYTLSFDALGGEGVGNDKKNVTYDSEYGDLPEPTKTGYTFSGWFTEEDGQGDKVKSEDIVKITEDHTLYAKWSINQYTIIIVFGNGAENEVRTLDYNEEIVYPENVEKTGYTFNGWDNKPERMPAENLTVTAQWISIEEPEEPSNPTNPTEYVEIVFGKGFTEEEEVKIILSDYTKEGFTITEFERDEKTGGTRVVIKFDDSKDAEEFVENVGKNGNSEDFFRNISFVPVKGSFSLVLVPLFMLYLLF